jgi:hypothetical protein
MAGIAILPFQLKGIEPEHGFDLVSNKWEKGVTEIQLKCRNPAQESGGFGETIISARYEGLIQGVTNKYGKGVGILRNLDSTITGVNLKPATEVNQIYLVIKGSGEQIQIYQDFSLILIPALASLQKKFTQDDHALFFLTGVDTNRITIQYRGPKLQHPPIKPFEFEMDVAANGHLTLHPNSVKEL